MLRGSRRLPLLLLWWLLLGERCRRWDAGWGYNMLLLLLLLLLLRLPARLWCRLYVVRTGTVLR